MNERNSGRGPVRPVDERLGGAPISWGVCEVPGWGEIPAAEDVLGQMHALGLRGTELGAPGFLPADPVRLRDLLARHELQLVGGFLALVLHERDATEAAASVRATAELFAAAGADTLVFAAVQDDGWSEPRPLDADGWRQLAAHAHEIAAIAAEHGVSAALHPHVGTLVQTAEEVQHALEHLDVGWCLDTGHLFIGGADPVAFAREHGDRIVHVHLKDVDADVAARLRAGRLTLLSATRAGLFRPLGAGDAGIGTVLEALGAHGYDRWLVLEQDTAITADEPTVDGGPMLDAQRSIAYLHSAPRTQEVNR